MPPDLPETYYHDNVLLLFEHVENLYSDLLDAGQLEFFQRFAALGADAQKLYIRLLNRSHDCYRVSKLSYPEIASLDAAIAELDASGCIELNPSLERESLLKLFTKPELLAPCGLPGLKNLRRDAIEAALLERAGDAFFDSLEQSDDILLLNGRDEYLICQMLFFGNLNQSMTDFVLRDLGLYRFEKYRIDSEHRPYRSSAEIQHHWLLQQLEILLGLADSEDPAVLADCLDAIPRDIEPDAPAWRKCERLRYTIARQLERVGATGQALDAYRLCTLPPARERIVRVLAAERAVDEALELCRQMLHQPVDEQEIQFVCQFAPRLCKKHDRLPLSEIDALQRDYPVATIELELDYRDSVEIAVAEYFDQQDGGETCYYVENSLFNAVLGLLIWDAIFAPVPGAFYNPFQHRPSDFYAPDFRHRREDLLANTWAQLRDNEDIRRVVAARWEDKFGIMNPLVNWQAVDLELIERALARIEHAHWRAIFERILQDLRNNRAGFPDLVHFPPDGGYCLVEVKGPNDTLQHNQRRWMQYFSEHSIPHRLARVKWKTG